MSFKRKGFIQIDELVDSLTGDQVQNVLRELGAPLETIKQQGDEIRTACFMQCGKQHPTGERAIALNCTKPGKVWSCHDYDCSIKKGNLISLASLAMGLGPKPKGRDFFTVAKRIQSIVSGEVFDEEGSTARASKARESNEAETKPKVNIPFEENDEDRIRAIARLHERLTIDTEQMPPEVSRYVRRHPFLSDAVAAKWHLGYLTRSTGKGQSGGTMRGKFVVEVQNAAGKAVAFIGRDCEWEKQHAEWKGAAGDDKEPVKWAMPRSFYRGVEVFAQHRIFDPGDQEMLSRVGLVVVEGALDTVNLHERLGIPAVGLLSNQATEAQVRRIIELAREVADGVVTLMYDHDVSGMQGEQKDTMEFAKYVKVQRAWARHEHFRGRDPATLNEDEWKFIEEQLRCANA